VVAGQALVIRFGVVTCCCMLGSVSLSSTPRSTLTRLRDRASTDRADLYAVLDAGLICHLGLVRGGAPVMLPTGYAHASDTIYLHASTGAGYLRSGRRSGLRVGHPPGRDRLRPLGVPPLDELPKCRGAWHCPSRKRSRGEVAALNAIVEHLALQVHGPTPDNRTGGSWRQLQF
jgi:hypothetical protein